jgi:hypothetical protein
MRMKVQLARYASLGLLAMTGMANARSQSSAPVSVLTQAPLCMRDMQLANPQWLAMPIGCISDWASNVDYPPDALKAQTDGWTILALNVSETGVPVSCKIAFGGHNHALDEQTCALVLERAHFKPATDVTGKPIVGGFFLGVVWQMQGMTINLPPSSWHLFRSRVVVHNPYDWFNPDNPTVRVLDKHEGTVGFDLTISAFGVPVACAIGRSSHDVALDQGTCDLLMNLRQGFTPAIDELGNPVADHVIRSVHWQIPRD